VKDIMSGPGLDEVPFVKMHSLGNDCIIVDGRPNRPAHGIRASASGATWACDRHFGIGADQLVVLEHSPSASALVRFFNTDGREAGACGNATRCVAQLLLDELRHASATGARESIELQTIGGVVVASRAARTRVPDAPPPSISTRLPAPSFDWRQVPLSIECDVMAVAGLAPPGWAPAVCLSMGNPQCVLFAPSEVALADLSLREIAEPVERHSLFPQGVNVMLVTLDRQRLPDRSDAPSSGDPLPVLNVLPWERSVGATQACTTGACAAVVAASLRGLLPSPEGPDEHRAQAECRFATRAAGALRVVWRCDGTVEAECAAVYAYRGCVARSSLERL
jgi:diaminopimelate epimerase